VPTSYRIDSQRRTIFSTAKGVLQDDDLRSHQSEVLADVEFDRGFDQLWDFREVERVEVSTAMLGALASARSYEAGVKRAMVAPSDLGFGMARMFQMLHDHAPEEIQVFRSMEEAEAWLGLT